MRAYHTLRELGEEALQPAWGALRARKPSLTQMRRGQLPPRRCRHPRVQGLQRL